MGLKTSLKQGIGGILYGGIAFVSGYLLTFLIMSSRVERLFSSTMGTQIDFAEVVARYGESTAPSAAKVVSWFYLGAHTVTFEMKAEAVFGGSDSAVVAISDSPVWMDSLFIIPPVVLVVLGYVYSRTFTRKSASSMIGGTVAFTIGYGGVALLASFFSYWVLNVGLAAVALGPNGSDYVLLLLYPLVFGTAGGLLGVFRG